MLEVQMIRLLLPPLLLVFLWSPLIAQEKSVNPGINKSFENPDVPEFIERFETQGRDAFDHRKEIVAALHLKPGMGVADVGAGTGLFARTFSPLVGKSGKVFTVDISGKFVAHVEETAKEQGLKNIEGVVCAPNDVRLPPQSVDLVFICDTYHHFEFPEATMRSIHEALKPGGQVVLIDFARIEGVSSEWVMNHVRAGQEVFTQEIVDAGFKQIGEEKGLLKESYFVRFKKTEPAVKGSIVALIGISPKSDTRGLPSIGVSPKGELPQTSRIRSAVREIDGERFIEIGVTSGSGDQPADDDRQVFRMQARRLDRSNRVELRVKSAVRWRLAEDQERKIIVKRSDDGGKSVGKLQFDPGDYILEVEESVDSSD